MREIRRPDQRAKIVRPIPARGGAADAVAVSDGVARVAAVVRIQGHRSKISVLSGESYKRRL